MKLVIAGVLAASTLALVVPAAAQGIYIGPRGGVGVGVGADPYYGGRYDGYDYGDEPVYQGRSVTRDRAYRDGNQEYDYDREDLDGF